MKQIFSTVSFVLPIKTNFAIIPQRFSHIQYFSSSNLFSTYFRAQRFDLFTQISMQLTFVYYLLKHILHTECMTCSVTFLFRVLH